MMYNMEHPSRAFLLFLIELRMIRYFPGTPVKNIWLN